MRRLPSFTRPCSCWVLSSFCIPARMSSPRLTRSCARFRPAGVLAGSRGRRAGWRATGMAQPCCSAPSSLACARTRPSRSRSAGCHLRLAVWVGAGLVRRRVPGLRLLNGLLTSSHWCLSSRRPFRSRNWSPRYLLQTTAGAAADEPGAIGRSPGHLLHRAGRLRPRRRPCDLYRFDNSDFVRFLQSRGFVVPENSRSNYPRTALSVASTLNMDYVEAFAPGCRRIRTGG